MAAADAFLMEFLHCFSEPLDTEPVVVSPKGLLMAPNQALIRDVADRVKEKVPAESNLPSEFGFSKSCFSLCRDGLSPLRRSENRCFPLSVRFLIPLSALLR
jgi:hypothetical protein